VSEVGARAFLGLGANLGDRAAAIGAALAALASRGAVRIARASSLYETEPLRPAGEIREAPWFLNRVAEVETALSPRDLLAALQETERSLGRAPGRARWAPREIDIDLLLHGDRIVRDPDLVVPHPGLTLRRFVLAPLAELAPDLIVPGTGRTVAAHLAALNDPLRVIVFRPEVREEPE